MLEKVLQEVDDLSRRRRSRVKGLSEFLKTMAERDCSLFVDHDVPLILRGRIASQPRSVFPPCLCE